MQYVEGEALDARLRRSPVDLHQILSTAVQIVDALSEAHAHGILHRDIKPGNIMVTTRGEAKVMDFGLAKQDPAGAASSEGAETISALSHPGRIVGTAPYMSPELARGDALDPRSDLSSVGVLLLRDGERPAAFPGRELSGGRRRLHAPRSIRSKHPARARTDCHEAAEEATGQPLPDGQRSVNRLASLRQARAQSSD